MKSRAVQCSAVCVCVYIGSDTSWADHVVVPSPVLRLASSTNTTDAKQFFNQRQNKKEKEKKNERN